MKKFAYILIYAMHMRLFCLFHLHWIAYSFFSGFPYISSHVNSTVYFYIAFYTNDGVYLFLIDLDLLRLSIHRKQG